MPDAKQIQQLADFLKNSRYGGQGSLDQKMIDLYLQRHRIEGRRPPADLAFRAVGTGFVGLLVDQDVSILNGDWMVRIAARGTEDERLVSGKLEPAVRIAFEKMERFSEVKRSLVKDSRIYGRAFALGPIPDPKAWGAGLSALYDDDADKDEIDDYKRENDPVLWQHWNAPDVYATFTDRHQPDCVIYHRDMFVSDVRALWGEDALPNKRRFMRSDGSFGDTERLPCIHYVDNEVYTVVIGDKKDPRVAHEWKHKMRCTPVTFIETNKLPENDQGWRWAGAALHIRESIHALDDAFTDWRTHIRQSPRTPLVASVNPETRGLIGWPSEVKVTGADNETINLLLDEKLERGPIPGMNERIEGFIDRMTSIVGLLGVRRDALLGQGPSGQSAVHLNVAQTLEKGELAEAKAGLERGARQAVQLLLKSWYTICTEYPDAPDTIPVSDGLDIKASDVKGYGDRVSVSVDLNLPINEGLAVQAAAQATASRLLDPYSARERFLRVENPAEIDDKWAEYEILQDAIAITRAKFQARLAGGIDEIQSDPALMERFQSLPLVAQAAIAEAFGTAPAPGPNVGRSQANRGRTGAGQDMSTLQGEAVRLP